MRNHASHCTAEGATAAADPSQSSEQRGADLCHKVGDFQNYQGHQAEVIQQECDDTQAVSPARKAEMRQSSNRLHALVVCWQLRPWLTDFRFACALPVGAVAYTMSNCTPQLPSAMGLRWSIKSLRDMLSCTSQDQVYLHLFGMGVHNMLICSQLVH